MNIISLRADNVKRLHAKVKVKLAAFPSLIAQEWTPAYLGKLKALK